MDLFAFRAVWSEDKFTVIIDRREEKWQAVKVTLQYLEVGIAETIIGFKNFCCSNHVDYVFPE